MYVLSNSSIPVADLTNTGWRFGQYRLAIWPIRVGDLANTGWQLGQYQRRYCFHNLGRFEVEIDDSKNLGVLELCLDMGSRIKKIDFATEVSLQMLFPKMLYCLYFHLNLFSILYLLS